MCSPMCRKEGGQKSKIPRDYIDLEVHEASFLPGCECDIRIHSIRRTSFRPTPPRQTPVLLTTKFTSADISLTDSVNIVYIYCLRSFFHVD